MRAKLLVASALIFGLLSGIAHADAVGEDKVLRVCADPNNLPLSHQNRQGYENKIAELLAAELGWKVEYNWFPQRMAFVRNTLRAREPNADRYKCDLIPGVPVGFELAATTKPYLRSTYALAYVRGKGLDSVKTPEDLLKLPPEKLRQLKLGAFQQTPPIDWILKNDLMNQLIPYVRMSGDPADYPGEIVERDLVEGKIDVAFVWGPIGGYFGKKVTQADVAVVPFAPDPQIKFDYTIAMGVRFGEKEWKDRIDQLLDANRAKIQDILFAYGVPQLDEAGKPLAAPAARAAK